MKFGESAKIADGTALGTQWFAEVRGFNNGPAGRVMVMVDGESVDLCHMDEHLEYEEFIMISGEITRALAEALAVAKGVL